METQSTHTLAEALFVLTAFMVAPAFGLAGLMLGARRIASSLRVLIPLLMVLAGLAGVGAVVLTMYPDYPYIGPPEKQAASLVVAGHALGLAAVAWLAWARRADEEAPPAGLYLASLGAWALATVASFVIAMTSVMPPRLALPAEATRVEERMEGHKLRPEFSYHLQADMSAAGYQRYLESLGMPDGAGTLREVIHEDCGTRTDYAGGRMQLSSWCE